jgi:ABC-type transporter Mla maintaining outer membrane lipid asymmetry ATPase subunit MlaF
VTAPVLELTEVTKNYQGLRPLRIKHLTIAPGEQTAILGLDQVAAEVFVNIVTGAVLPDQGDVKVFGQSTGSIEDSTAWLALLDRFGIVTERAVLLEQLDVLQNLAVPFTLDIEPPPRKVLDRVAGLASEVGIMESMWNAKVATLDQSARTRIRMGRALALDPVILLMEHVSAGLTHADAAAFGTDARAVAARRGLAIVAVTVDEDFSRSVAARVLQWDAASGRLTESRRGWFRGLLD